MIGKRGIPVVIPRKHQRYGLEVPVVFSWKDVHDVRQGIGLTRNLSLGGAFIFATTLPPSGATLRIKAFLPPSGANMPALLRWRGEVVRLEQGHDQVPSGFAVAADQRIVLRRGEATP